MLARFLDAFQLRSFLDGRWPLWGCYFQPGKDKPMFFGAMLVFLSAILVLFSAEPVFVILC